MITSEIFDINISKNLTKKDINIFLKKVNIIPIKWNIVGVSENKTSLLVTYEKKPL